MDKHNPYAPSRASLKQTGPVGNSDAVRRDGKWVVMPVGASLPHRCVKCNGEPLDPTKARKLYWHHPAIYILIFVAMLIYIIVALSVRKTAVVEPALCAEHKSKRRTALLVAWGLFLGAFIVPIALSSLDATGGLLLGSVLMILFAIYFGFGRARIVYAKSIDDHEIRLGGCGEDFLDSLPGY
jgi:hypothetical protein